MNRLKWLTLVVIVFITVVIISKESNSSNQVNQVKQLPAVKLTDIETREAVQLELIEGSFLLNIWGSWCVACAREHDFLLQLQQSGVRIIGVSYMDSSERALQWLNSKGNPYERSLLDDEGILGKALNIKGAPESYLIDSNGQIQYKHSGILTAAKWPAIAAKLNKLE